MNAITRPLAFAAAAVGAGVQRLQGGVMRFASRATWGFSLLLGRTNINYASAVGDPSRNSIVIAVVGWIARNFPEAPVRIRRLKEDGGADVIAPGPDGPGFMLRLLERPNPYFSGVLQWIATIIDLFTTGNAYWLKIRAGQGAFPDRVVELWWVPSRMMRPAWPDDGSEFISGYFYKVDGRDYWIEKRDVLHYRDGLDPNNPRLGLSKLASLFREIYTDDEAANFSAVLLTNLGVPGVVIAPANTGGVGQRTDPETIKTAFMEKFGGDRRGEPLVLTSPTDVKVLSFSPDQMNLKELRRIPEERITAVLGVSAIVAGLGAGLDRSTFTNFGEARLAAYHESIVPLQRLIAAELEVQLLTEFADIDRDPLDVDFDISKASAMQAALDAIWRRMESAATKGLVTRAAFKQATGQPVTPEDEVYIIASNYVILPANKAAPSQLTRQAGGSFPPAGTTQAIVDPVSPTPLLGAGEIRCSNPECGKLLAEQATPPYRFTCRSCKAVTESEPAAA
jgi:HK97 family phage portal protein